MTKSTLALIVLTLPLIGANKLPGFYLTDYQTEDLVPLPLAWNNASYPRVISASVTILSNYTKGTIITAKSVHSDSFWVKLKLLKPCIFLELKTEEGSYCDLQNVATEVIQFTVNFDKKLIILNNGTKFCNLPWLARSADSLLVTLGGIKKGCITIDSFEISDDAVRLEAANLDYLQCTSTGNEIVVSRAQDPAVNLEPRGHAHHNY